MLDVDDKVISTTLSFYGNNKYAGGKVIAECPDKAIGKFDTPLIHVSERKKYLL